MSAPQSAFQPAPQPPNETKRVEALRNYHILDTSAERAFDDLAMIASAVCQAPIALVTLIDEERQWFKARVGVAATETPREQAFCAYTILEDKLLVVEDARKDERFAGNPLVTGEPRIRFYAGAPLINRDGLAIGSLCVIDREPRQLSAEQGEILQRLSRQVMAQLELRRVSAELAQSLVDLRILEGLLPMCSFCKSIRSDAGYWRSVENYICSHSEARISHGICPGCLQAHHPEVYQSMVAAGDL